MTTQSEFILEQNLIAQLSENGYEKVVIKDEPALLANLKAQLEKHNGKTFSDADFQQILNHLTKTNNVFEKAKILRDKFSFRNDRNEVVYVEFMNLEHWCQNQYQVTSQVTMHGSYTNRYDVTLLINGLPVVQIELKRRGLEMKEAYNQISRYSKHSFGASLGLFNFVQLFVISNGVNTKYFSNFSGQKPDFKQTFYWTDDNNNRISALPDFASAFLEKCHLSKMIAKYIVLHEGDKMLMVLRPYQFFAVERIIDRVKTTNKNGYIWHTTGSGKTLTSFKASQILSRLPKVDKVVFCVDRRDLDYQTSREFNAFSPDSIDPTNNTKGLVAQFANPNVKLIVTTIQKLNTAISREHHKRVMDTLRDQKVVFIFDECHRSQFGETHKAIRAFFNNHQMFGFTGTPIFADNAVSKSSQKQTTAMLFGEKLHQYVITDAIKDQNVLRFSVEYVGRYKQKGSVNDIDIEVEAIDTKELMQSQARLEKIAGYIAAQHGVKTMRREFTAMFCVSDVDTLIRYMDIFRQAKRDGLHDLNIATIFSYGANEGERDGMSDMDQLDFADVADPAEAYFSPHTRDKLEVYIKEYNETFGCNFTTKDTNSFYDYYKDISQKVRQRKIDILLVVNMFLTGFDSKTLNTLYVDKNLRHHGLIQAYSRTNRIFGQKKSQGNIVAFRNLKSATDEAIALFSNKHANEIIVLKPYASYVSELNLAYHKLKQIVPMVGSVDELRTEEEELAFIKAFRELMRLKNTASSFVDFTFDDLDIEAQEFEDYASKYWDLNEKVRRDHSIHKDSILNEVDFELELLHRDDITVSYIIRLLAALSASSAIEKERRQKEILDLVSGDGKLRSKRELIEKFILENLPLLSQDDVEQGFEAYMDAEKRKAFEKFVSDEELDASKLGALINDFLFTQRTPNHQQVIETLVKPPSVLQRKSIGEKLMMRFRDFVSTFFDE